MTRQKATKGPDENAKKMAALNSKVKGQQQTIDRLSRKLKLTEAVLRSLGWTFVDREDW